MEIKMQEIQVKVPFIPSKIFFSQSYFYSDAPIFSSSLSLIFSEWEYYWKWRFYRRYGKNIRAQVFLQVRKKTLRIQECSEESII